MIDRIPETGTTIYWTHGSVDVYYGVLINACKYEKTSLRPEGGVTLVMKRTGGMALPTPGFKESIIVLDGNDCFLKESDCLLGVAKKMNDESGRYSKLGSQAFEKAAIAMQTEREEEQKAKDEAK